jgi:DNA-binding transcriptional MerR regulator
MKQGYTGPQVCKIVGISYRQLDHWTTTKLIKSSLRNIKGSGHHREYSFEDLLKIKIIKNLRDTGMSLQKIRIALNSLQKILNTGASYSDITVVSDGQSIYASKNENDFIDILRKGQAVFGISLGPVHDEIEQQVIDLWSSGGKVQDGKK